MLESTTIKFTQWKRVPDGTKMRFKEIEETLTKADFCVKFDKDLAEFRDHVDRVHTQYSELKRLRENLPENEVLIWMDFAENFGCVSVEEVQSAYWNAAMVSLHTMGPCDGLGASVKTAAENAVKQGKTSIQSADDFMEWARRARESGSKVKYIFYNQQDYDISEKFLSERITPVAVKGTFKIHYVIGNGINEVYSRVTSCYCNKCIVDISTSTCEGYTLHRLVKDVGTGGVVETLESLEQEGETVEDRNLEEEVEMNRQRR
ncbi:unnamed protein product [Mytilus coruscus]|uniref:Uncharacterized protein n=1 Tax=Mytilus coruscus TaxID=42192 RepID=A0A6J8B458_MYTCO|nr:unnamed protein product [Mytilus coruscus]